MSSRMVLKLMTVKIKLFMRELPAVFFTLVFTPMILIVFGLAYGNTPEPMFNNLGSVDISIPAYVAIIIVGVSLISMPIAVAASKERGELRRLELVPVKKSVYMLVEIFVYFLLVLIGVIFLSFIGKVIFDAKYSGSVLATMIALMVSTVAFFSLGFFIVTFSKSAKTAQAIGMFLSFPMMFLSGAGMPLELMPDELLRVTDYIPLKYVVTLMRGVWAGNPLQSHMKEIFILLGMTLIFGVFTVRKFKWE